MSLNFRELLQKYELDALARGHSDKQIAIMRLSIGQFDTFLNSPIDARRVTADDYRRFIVHLRTRHAQLGSGKESNRLLSGNTVNTYGRNVKTFFARLHEMEITTTNALAGVRAPKLTKKVPIIYSEKQLLAVSAAVSGLRDRAIYELFLDSGIRLNELSTIKIGAIDVEKGTVKVMGKGNIERFAYFCPLVAESIRAYIQEFRSDAKKEDFLFVTSTGRPLKSRGIQIMLSRLGEKAGLEERLAPHKLRHTFATLAKKYGGDLEDLRKLLGHTNVKTTTGYINVPDEDVKAAHTAFSPITNLKASKASLQIAVQPSEKTITPGQPNRSNTDDAENGIRTGMEERYNTHLRKLADLGGELVNDIENGNLEPTRYNKKANPEAIFGGLRLTPVFRAQNHRLWPFLSKHLDNEFTHPKLTVQIGQIAMAAAIAHILKKESQEKELTAAVMEKLITVSERNTFVGKCNICESYFSE